MKVFELPDLGEGLADAELVRWLVEVGDRVTVDQPIAEVETAKSVVEVPSPYAGVVAVRHGAEGETLTVGSPLLEVEEETESVTHAPVAAPGAQEETGAASGSGQVLVGYGTADHTTARRRSRGVLAPVATLTDRVVPVVSPVVRSLARSHGIDLALLVPTGEGGVVTRRDVETALAGASTASAVPGGGGTPGTPTGAAPDTATGLAVAMTTPFSRFRRTVAEAMVRSRTEIPEATVWVDVDATELWVARRRLVADGRSPSLLAFVARFALAALAGHPELAGRIGADGATLTTFEGVNLGFAADTPRGLVVPVLRRADRLSVWSLDAELARLTTAARAGTLPPAELTGSTFTVNNYGSLGVDGSVAIINPPEVAILGVGRMSERPWVFDGAIVPRRIVQLSLVFDHRVTDGGVAAGFLREVADAVESPLAFLADEAPGTVSA